MTISFLCTFRSTIIATLATALAASALSGCGIGTLSPADSGPSSHAINNLNGKAMGGNTPIGGATVTLYATALNTSISNGTYVGTATSLGTATTTIGTGAFAFGTVTSCAANSLVYVTISGGNTGAGSNSDILLGAVLGVCGSLSSYAVVNEATTIAMAYAFSSFTSIDGSGNVNITAPANNSSMAATNVVGSGTVTAASGLSHAYANFLNLVNVPNGAALAVPVSNSSAIAPQAVINSLASVLQTCVNSSGSGGTTCGPLFAATPGLDASTPANTFQAALNLARNPNGNVTGVFSLLTGIGAAAVYTPNLGGAPHDWTLAIQYPVPANPYSGTAAFPFTLALDADDNVYVTSPEDDPWAANATSFTTTDSIGACLYGWTSNGSFRPTIAPYTGTGGTVGVNGTGTAGSSSWFCTSSAAATTQTDYLLAAIAPDNVGNIWLTNYGVPNTTTPASGFNRILRLTNTGAFGAEEVPPVQTVSGATQSFQPVGMAVDKLNDVFFPYLTATASRPNVIGIQAGSTGSTFTALQLGTATSGPAAPGALRGISIDSLGNIWGGAFNGSSQMAGSLTLNGGAVVVPIVGAQTTSSPANYNCTTGCTSQRIGKAVGGGSTSNSASNTGPYDVAIDSANNAWVTAGGAPGQTITPGVVGLFECVPTVTSSVISALTCGSTSKTPVTAPKFLEADGNNVLWVADTTGILAYASTASPAVATISETGGFKPCIVGSGTTCTYPDFNASIKGIAIDSTGSVWFTTPDTTHSNTNANALVQIIGTASATWPLLATQKPGVMPQ